MIVLGGPNNIGYVKNIFLLRNHIFPNDENNYYINDFASSEVMHRSIFANKWALKRVCPYGTHTVQFNQVRY